MRFTKIRTRYAHQISIPNQDAAKLDIDKIGRRPPIRRKFNITTTYDTPPVRIARALELLRGIPAGSETDGSQAKLSTSGGYQEPKSHPN